jgi:PAS domain S-box-containing protein
MGRRLAEFWTRLWMPDESERERLSAVIDHSDVAILAVDARGRVVIWNAAMADLTDLPASSAVGRRTESLFTLTDEDGNAVGIAERPRGSVRLTTAAGRSLWVEISSSAMADGAETQLLTAVFVDKSAKRQLDYTRHLLLASIHHELHGPLTMIRGHAQLLEPVLCNEDSAESLEAIVEAVDMMQHVIADLVMLVDTNPAERSVTPAVPTEMEPLLRRTLLSVPSVAARTVVSAEPGITVLGEPVRLRQCLLLLLNNAEKYAPDGTITITTSRLGAHGVIDITDEGPGIPPARRHLALRPYYRLPAAKELPGSGLGLHIAEAMMTAMNGRIELADAPSGGLKVRLWLPLAHAAPAKEHATGIRSWRVAVETRRV